MHKGFFESLSATTVIPAGLGSAVVSGIASGAGQSVKGATKALAVLSEHSGQRDSLLRSLNALFDDQPALENSVLATYFKDLVPALNATNNSLALVVRNILLGGASGLSQVAQIPLDASIALGHAAKGLSALDIPADKMQEAFKQAFTFDEKGKGASVSASAVSDSAGKQTGQVMKKVSEDIEIKDNSHAASHAKTAATGAGGTMGVTAMIPSAVGLVTDAIGQVPRELSAIHHFSAAESKSQEGVYHLSGEASKATQEGDTHASRKKLGDLQTALTEMAPAPKLMSQQTVTSPFTTALLRLVALSLFIEGSRGLSKTTMVLSDERLRQALKKITEQNPSGGVDRINSTQSNLSLLSNILRLCAENIGGPSAIRSAVVSSEVVSSRSATVLVSHVSELANAMRDLLGLKDLGNPKESLSNVLNSPIDSANKQALGATEAAIKQVLDRIEQENGVIPHLNKDMASQLSAASHTGVAALISTHSIFTNPVKLVSDASNAATKVNEAQKNEALMETLPGLTRALNAIQAATRNALAEMQPNIEKKITKGRTSKSESGTSSLSDTSSSSFLLSAELLSVEDRLLSIDQSANSQTAVLYAALSAISLLADEMISICRSLTLIDQNRLKEASQKTNEVQSKDETQQASQQIAWDSHSEEPNSATHAIPALRLTLSHTGIALMRIALDLHKALQNNLDTVKQDLAMHTLQRTLLRSGAEASVALAESGLFLTGAASAFPVSFKDSANSSHKLAHSSDAHLHPAQTHDSEQSSKGGSESTQFTGFSTDLVAGTISNVFKVLAQTSIVGLDTTIQLIKLLEIISLHRDSHIALRLETNDSANPNGVSKNALQEPSVASTAGINAIIMNILAAFQTFDQSTGTHSTLNAQDQVKKVIDQQIESVAVLKDDEELDDKKGLREFYKVIIRLLSPLGSDADRDSLVKRLDLGGISLSDYHTGFGAYTDRPASDREFIKRFAQDDDAQGILRRFIDKAKKNFPLLVELHNRLPEESRTNKAQILYQHVFDEVFQHYKQMKLSDVATHGTSKRRIPTTQSFIEDIGLGQEEPAVNADQSVTM